MQRSVVKLAGFLYLLQMATAIFAYAVRSRMLVPGDAAKSAANIAASERLFRISLVSDVITVVAVIILLWALYVILEPINRHLALLAVLLRLAENAVAAAALINSFMVLRILSGANYLRAFEPAQLQVLARVLTGGHPAGLSIAFVFCGLGTTVFSYVWLKSGYIPKALAVWGIFSSLVLAFVTAAFMVFPEAGARVGLAYMAPMFVYEVGLGFWLLFKGIRNQ